MIEIDGSEGGGQLLRSALSLAALTGEPFRMTDVRGGRSTPGLRPQHLAAVELLADVCDAETSAAEVGTEALTFRPGSVAPGEYAVDVGTAGSVTLLFDAALPLALATPGPIVVAARGGTDVKWSPTTAHYRRVKLRLLRRHGLGAAVEVDRPGFYPAGGGEATLRIAPSRLDSLSLSERGAVVGARIHSTAATDLAEPEVAERQAEAAVEGLEEVGVPTVERTVRYADADSPGSALAIRLDCERSLLGADALGERGRPAEDVAEAAVERATALAGGTAAVDRHTADQLLVFLTVAGGRVRIPAVTDHVAASLDLLATFGLDVDVERVGDRHPDEREDVEPADADSGSGTAILTAEGRAEPGR